MVEDPILGEIEDLVKIADQLARDAAVSPRQLGADRIEQLSSVAVRGGQVIHDLFGPQSQYSSSWKKVLATPRFTNMHSNYHEHVSAVSGILKALRQAAPAAIAARTSASSKRSQPKKAIVRSEIDERTVFIVHGHDLAARDAVELFVRRVGLSPTILSERPNRGSTVIEKIEREGVCAFAVVLLTPDDRGGPKDSDPSSYRERARQNVLLELGYFIGKIGRNRVCALYKGNVEIPSDYSGVVWVRFDDAGAWKKELGKEFLAAKLPADLTTG